MWLGWGVVTVGNTVSVNLRVNEDDWEAFKQFVVQTHGQKYGNLGREASNALSEYADNDRLARMESRLETIEAYILENDSSHTHKGTDSVKKTERIAEKLQNIDREVIPTDDVVRSIEDVAGGDGRTVEKYRRLLKSRGLAYEHPSDSEVWTCNRDEWLKWAVDYVNNNPTVQRTDVIEDYPIKYREIEQLATEVLA